MLAAPVAHALAVVPGRPGVLARASLSSGGCFARPLPADTTCAAAARRYFREALACLPLPSGLLHDGVTMASELAANTLHAQRGAPRTAPGGPEIWLYLRGDGPARQLVCKVFDTERGWDAAARSGPGAPPLDAVSGRGLQVVAGLSAGQWGCHVSRSRLGHWKVPGKAVWFALQVPPATAAGQDGAPGYGPEWLTDELQVMLGDRGLGDAIVRADRDGMAVLSVSRHLTVWRHGARVSWRVPGGQYAHMDLADLVDVAEQIVRAHEEAELADARLGGFAL